MKEDKKILLGNLLYKILSSLENYGDDKACELLVWVNKQ